MSKYELGVIGGGNMAEAILRGVTSGGLLPASAIIVSDPVAARRELLAKSVGVATTSDNREAAQCGRVLLAVKPQMMPAVLGEIASAILDEALVISIAAGITTQSISGKLAGAGRRGAARIIRVMPNTPMLVGAGVSAVAAGPGATQADIDWTARAFSQGQSGGAVIVEESMIDAVTAVSGSGPAYFFYLVEAMVAAGVAEGLPPRVALELARQTCLGSGLLLTTANEDPASLRAKVTSPNGTTQRAIETMDAAGVKDSLIKSIRAAATRSRELGRG